MFYWRAIFYANGDVGSQIVSVICSGVGGGGRPEPAGAGGDPGGGGGGPGSLNIGHLIGQTLAALQNPDCAALFGGFQNAVDAISNSTYNLYTGPKSNPGLDSQTWSDVVKAFSDPNTLGLTYPSSSQPGGTILFGNGSGMTSGFAAPFSYQQTWQSVFLHELEHASTFYYDPKYSDTIDGPGYPGDGLKLNSACQPPQFETTSPPIGTTLIPQG